MKIDEMLSAAMDGECTPEELDQLLQALADEPAAMQRWQRWSAAKAAISGARVGRVSTDWSNAVMKSISMEARPVVPAKPLISLPFRGIRVAQAPRRRRARWAAASVTASLSAMAVGWMLMSSPSVEDAASPLVSPSTVNSASTQVAQADDDLRYRSASSQADAWLLNDYLMTHHQMAGSQTMGSTLRRAQFDVVATNAVFEESRP